MVETDIITSITASLMILVKIYIETFKIDVIVFIRFIKFVVTDKITTEINGKMSRLPIKYTTDFSRYLHD